MAAKSLRTGVTKMLWVCAISMSAARVVVAAQSAEQAEPPFQGKIAVSVKDSVPDWPRPIIAPVGAPNIVVILLDDMGFGDSSVFGGPVQMPELEALASQGLRYNRFHVSALCSPTRAALLGGRNDHRMGFGTISNATRGYPGYNGVWKKSTASIAEVLKRNGYSTAAFGKWHNTSQSEVTPIGPFDRWPTGLGFEYFYGFLKGSDSQYETVLHRNTTLVAPPKTPAQGYHFTTDIVDEAIRWVRTHKSLAPEKPYFLYFATAAPHGPHHVPKEWIEKYRGQFSQGWDRLREEIFSRQKKLGVIPANTKLTPRPNELAAWDSLSSNQKKLLSRQMEVYAGFLAHTDHEIGRLLKTVQAGAQGQNTLILYIAGDNGGDVLNEHMNPAQATAQLDIMQELGGERHINYYAAGWGWASNTPFRWGKTVASHLGGTRNPMIVSWPARIKDRGAIRSQFTHVIDVASTVYEVTGVKFPSSVDGVHQLPLDGTSFAYSFSDEPNAPSRHHTQIFEQLGNRAIYQDGWWAAARHTIPWVWGSLDDYEQDRWELYNIEEDFSQAHDLSVRYPDKLEALQKLFDREARKNDIYPLGYWDEWGVEPSLITGKRSFTYSQDQAPLQLYGVSVPNFKDSHRISTTAVIPPQGAEGVVLSYGSRNGGFVLYMKNDRLVYEHVGSAQSNLVTSNRIIPTGTVKLAYEFIREDAEPENFPLSPEAHGTGRLFVNDELVGETKVTDFARAWLGTLDIGRAGASPVSTAYESPFKFTGILREVTVELK